MTSLRQRRSVLIPSDLAALRNGSLDAEWDRACNLRLEGERCWKLGLIVSELLTNVARHVQFDDRHPELRVELMLVGNVVKCGGLGPWVGT
jgi:two-component sensor histidine kinase